MQQYYCIFFSSLLTFGLQTHAMANPRQQDSVTIETLGVKTEKEATQKHDSIIQYNSNEDSPEEEQAKKIIATTPKSERIKTENFDASDNVQESSNENSMESGKESSDKKSWVSLILGGGFMIYILYAFISWWNRNRCNNCGNRTGMKEIPGTRRHIDTRDLYEKKRIGNKEQKVKVGVIRTYEFQRECCFCHHRDYKTIEKKIKD